VVSIVLDFAFLERTTLAKKKTPAAAPRKSDVIREILKSQPKATVRDVRTALQERGVKASDALINKIKYGRKPTAKRFRARGSNGSGGTKADAIRGVFGEMGAKARSRDVVAVLAARGIKVTSAQVSTLRKTVGGSRAKIASTYSVSLDHLMAAKALAQRLGGIAVAQRALESLAKLTEV
jgi:uncharacterized protein YneF (UPF0154 family)